MEKDQELIKLVNVLRRTSRMAMQAHWTGGNGGAAAHCVGQYNRVRARMAEVEPSVDTLFEPLPDDSTLTVVAMACRQLAAYYEDEIAEASGWGRVYGAAFDTESFKDFWHKSASEIEDLGEYIRENIESWLQQHRDDCRKHHRRHRRRDQAKETTDEPKKEDEDEGCC